MLAFYRDALRLRRTAVPASETPLTGSTRAAGVLAFGRGADLACVANLSPEPYALPGDVLLASAHVTGGQLPPDAAAWTTRPS